MKKKNESGMVKKNDSGMMKKLGFPIAILIFVLAWFVPFAGMDELTRRSLGLMLFTVTLWITRPIVPSLAAMLFMVLAWLLNIAPFKTAFSGFSQTTTWFIWAALIIALAVKETRLGLRLARFLATKTPASSKGLLGSYYILLFLMTYLVPSSTARVAAMAPIGAAQIETLGIPLKSRTGKMLMLSLVSLNAYVGQFLLTGGSSVVTAWGILAGLGFQVSWIQWWLYMLVPGLVALAVNFIVNLLIFRPEPARAAEGVSIKEIARKELAELGPMSTREKKVSIILGTTLLLWATEPLHGLDTALVCCLTGIALCFPGIGVLDAKHAFRNIGWDTVVFVAAALSIGAVTEATGVSGIIANIVGSVLTIGNSEFTFLFLMLILGLTARMVLRSGAAIAAVLLAPTITLALSLGYSPIFITMFFPLSTMGLFMYQHSSGLIAYDYGTFEEPDFIMSSLARYVALMSFIVVAYFVWWPIAGMII